MDDQYTHILSYNMFNLEELFGSDLWLDTMFELCESIDRPGGRRDVLSQHGIVSIAVVISIKLRS